MPNAVRRAEPSIPVRLRKMIAAAVAGDVPRQPSRPQRKANNQASRSASLQYFRPMNLTDSAEKPEAVPISTAFGHSSPRSVEIFL